MFHRTTQALWASAILLTASGCQLDLKPGHYEGNLLWQQSTTPSGDPVGIDVEFDKDIVDFYPEHGSITLKSTQGAVVTTMSIDHIHAHHFDLSIPAVRPQPFRLVRVPKHKESPDLRCFVDHRWLAELCFEKNQLMLRVLDDNKAGVFKITASGFAREGFFPFEEPVNFRLSEAIERALHGNLDSRIAFEHVVQAKYAVLSAYLNLIPHITTNLIWNAQPSYISYIATAQGLVPFLFPSYWLSARESQWDKKIKDDALTIMKADLAAMVEQMAYAYDRDQEIVELQGLVLNKVIEYRARLVSLETEGKLKKGSAQSLEALENKIKSDQQAVSRLLREEGYALAQALGFHNPEGVTGIEVPHFDPGCLGTPYLHRELAETASRRSFEIQQIDYMKKIGKLKKIELFMTWIDPTGDPKSSLGFNTISQVLMANSQLRELDLKREQLKITVFQNSYRVADEYNATLEELKESLANTDEKDRDLDAILKHGLKTKKFMPKTLTRHVRNYLSQEIGKVAKTAAYRIAKSKVDRLMLGGFFEYLMPKMQKWEKPEGVSKDSADEASESMGTESADSEDLSSTMSVVP